MTVIDTPTYVSTYGPGKRAGRGTPTDGRESGFTVVELLVVIGIAAVLMSILVLGIRQASDSFALRRAGGIALSEVRRAQGQSLAERVDYTVEFVVGTPGGIRTTRTKLATETCPAGTTEVSATLCERRVSAPEEWPASVALVDDGGSPPPLPDADTDWLADCTAGGPWDPTNKCVTFQFMGAPASVGTKTSGAVLLRSRSGTSLWLTVTTGTGKVSVRR